MKKIIYIGIVMFLVILISGCKNEKVYTEEQLILMVNTYYNNGYDDMKRICIIALEEQREICDINKTKLYSKLQVWNGTGLPPEVEDLK